MIFLIAFFVWHTLKSYKLADIESNVACEYECLPLRSFGMFKKTYIMRISTKYSDGVLVISEDDYNRLGKSGVGFVDRICFKKWYKPNIDSFEYKLNAREYIDKKVLKSVVMSCIVFSGVYYFFLTCLVFQL